MEVVLSVYGAVLGRSGTEVAVGDLARAVGGWGARLKGRGTVVTAKVDPVGGLGACGTVRTGSAQTSGEREDRGGASPCHLCVPETRAWRLSPVWTCDDGRLRGRDVRWVIGPCEGDVYQRRGCSGPAWVGHNNGGPGREVSRGRRAGREDTWGRIKCPCRPRRDTTADDR